MTVKSKKNSPFHSDANKWLLRRHKTLMTDSSCTICNGNKMPMEWEKSVTPFAFLFVKVMNE